MHPAIFLNHASNGLIGGAKRSGYLFVLHCLFDIKIIPRVSDNYCLIAITEISTRALLTKPAA
jgi:hypothetical protein